MGEKDSVEGPTRFSAPGKILRIKHRMQSHARKLRRREIMKRLLTICVVVGLMLSAGGAQATSISETLGEFSSPYHDYGTYYDDYLVGTFTYDLMGEIIVSASISGQWGNSAAYTTAHNELWLDAIQLADTHDYSPDPYYTYIVPWSYNFTDFSVLEDGVAGFHTIQTSEFCVRLGVTTLTIETVPEPATICLLGLGGLALLKKRRA
jgi:hypothetical protein